MSQTILSLKNVSIYQEDNLIVSDINLEVQKGEFLYFIGKTCFLIRYDEYIFLKTIDNIFFV